MIGLSHSNVEKAEKIQENIEKEKNIENIKNKIKKECDVCCEKKTSIVKCPYCPYEACDGCYERVILDSINKPACMSCKKQFSDDFVSSSFSKVFRTKRLKAHRENLLLEIEMARMPATQPHVEYLKKREEMKEEIDLLAYQIKEMTIRRRELLAQYRWGTDAKEEKLETEKSSYVGACPKNDCRGFLSTKHLCGICGVKACADCRMVETEDHKCNKDDVASVNELKKTCKNCPNCMTTIFKTEGCDQMWCTKCNVAFSWKTGRLEKGVIHNPHYFEWLNRTGGGAPRNPHAERCGGMPEARFLSDKRLRVMIQLPDKRFGKTYRGQLACQFLTDAYREVQHIRNVILPVMPTVLDNQTNIDLRVDYLNGKITKDEMKVKLQRREKDRAKKLEYRDVLDMYCTVLQDMFYRLFETWNVREFVDEETRLHEHSNKAIESLNNRYNSKLHFLL